MTMTLPQVTVEHHARLTLEVDNMPTIGDMVGRAPVADLSPRVDHLSAFLTDHLIPHMEAAEQTLYPELERVLENRQSMAPMRREHAEIRSLISDLGGIRQMLADGRLPTGEAVTLRRVIFHLFAMLKVHLAEEQLYLDILEQGISPERDAALAAAMQHSGLTAT